MTYKRLTLIRAWLIAVLGLGFSVGLYFTAPPDPVDPVGYDDPRATKVYQRQMELYGGKANLLGSQIHDWFFGLWHGRSLAFTVGSLSVVSAYLFWLFAHHPDFDPEHPAHRGKPTGSPGD